MKITIKLTPFIKDVSFTAITSMLTVCSIIIVTRLLIQGLGSECFGAYSLSRLMLSAAMPFSTLAMGVAITRYMAMSRDSADKFKYFLSGFFVVIALLLLFLVAGITLRRQLTLLFFRDLIYVPLFISTLLAIAGFSVYGVLYALYRGMGIMKKANILQIIVMALGPIIIAVCFIKGRRADLVILAMGILAMAVLPVLIYYTYIAVKKIGWPLNIKKHISELLRYGLPRVPGGFGFIGIMAIGPFLAFRYVSLKDSGFLVAGQSIFRIVEGIAGAFGMVALPKIAQLAGCTRREFLKERLLDVTVFIFHIGIFISVHLFLWSDRIVLFWLGDQYVKVVYLLRIFSMALLPYLAFSMLHSPIDAIQKRAVNTLNIFIAFFIAIGSCFLLVKLGFGSIGLAIGTVIGFWGLGLLTIGYLARIYRFNLKAFIFLKSISLNIILAVVAMLIKYHLERNYSGLALIIPAIITEAAILFLYYIILLRLGVCWAHELKKRVMNNTETHGYKSASIFDEGDGML